MSDVVTRRAMILRGVAFGFAATGVGRVLAALPRKPAMLVYKDPSCGCCEKWVGIMRSSGFELSVQNTSAMAAI